MMNVLWVWLALAAPPPIHVESAPRFFYDYLYVCEGLKAPVFAHTQFNWEGCSLVWID